MNISIFDFLQQNPADNDSLFTVKGLEPRIDDLENINIFDDSSDETEGVSELLYALYKFTLYILWTVNR